jgi:hypothetical protein
MASPVSSYKRFHGRKPRNVSTRKFHDPKTLIRLGRALKIEYVSNKFNGGGDGKNAIYVHTFKPGATLYMDEKNGGQLYILGSRIKVTDAGIEN